MSTPTMPRATYRRSSSGTATPGGKSQKSRTDYTYDALEPALTGSTRRLRSIPTTLSAYTYTYDTPRQPAAAERGPTKGEEDTYQYNEPEPDDGK
ncbi:MAG: hypothetical protein ACLRSD_11110 [Oscillibacter sp.]